MYGTLTHRTSLTHRERDVLNLIGSGQSNKQAAQSLAVSPETVKSHVKRIFTKLEVVSRAQAVSRAQGLGLIASG